MKRFLVVLFLLVLVLAPSVRAEGPDDDYVTIYGMIQQGDVLSEKGETSAAIAKYVEAQGALTRFQKYYPDAYVKVVKFRLNYLAGKIQQLSSQTPPSKPNTNAQPQTPTNKPSASSSVTPPVTPAPENTEPAKPSPTAELENQVKRLQEQIHQMEADRTLLEAKLKEALAARPAEVDPQELAKAREQVTSLQKENELLKASIDSAKTNAAAAAVVPADLQTARQALAEANRKVAALTDANATLSQEKEVLQARMKTLGVADPAAAALREENELLKKQVAELKTKTAPSSPTEALDKKLQEAQAQIAAMQSDKEIMRLEKIALEAKVKQLTASGAVVPAVATTNAAPAVVVPATAPSPAIVTDSVTAGKIAQLEAQRDELQKSLETATRDAVGRRKGKEMAARIEEMTRQLASLRSRIQVFEATSIPYSAEEQALFSNPEPTLAASAHSGRKSSKEPPASAQMLLSEGRRYFVAHEFDKAEAKYQEALKLDPKNIGVLSDLASIELEAGHLDDAEKNLKTALGVEPEDDFTLFVLGQLKFREKKYDDAFEALSHAAQLKPDNARIQNSLGLTLSEKGLRGPAETAFRRAIQLDPGFADAHMNLAVVYATQQPPLLELARWHYQKALAAGRAPNPNLEKLFDPTRNASR